MDIRKMFPMLNSMWGALIFSTTLTTAYRMKHEVHTTTELRIVFDRRCFVNDYFMIGSSKQQNRFTASIGFRLNELALAL